MTEHLFYLLYTSSTTRGQSGCICHKLIILEKKSGLRQIMDSMSCIYKSKLKDLQTFTENNFH